MYDCRACLAHAFRVLALDAPVAAAKVRPTILTRLPPRRCHRGTRQYSDVIASNAPGERYLSAAQLRHQSFADDVTLERASKTSNGFITREERQLQKELIYLKDPLKLADHVRHLVFKEDVEKALALCRLASKTMSCVVAWNHLVDWHMRSGKFKDGIKLYNEMKKRAQHPDSYTYMLLLRSLAVRDVADRHHAASAANAEQAVNIYNSMSSPASRVKPSIIHTNAALKACSHSTDMDAFWGIVGQLPESGPNCADRITYTTILQAIKHGAAGDFATSTSPDERKARRRQAVDEGRRIWQQVVTKWRAGILAIDEPVVHAMARVLMQSPDIADWDSVFDLIEQTTGIPRPVPRIGTPGRSISHVPDQQDGQALDEPLESDPIDDEKRKDLPLYKVFRPFKQPTTPRSDKVKLVVPDNAILSVALDSATMMRVPKAAIGYWEAFTSEYGVRADPVNFHAFLRQLALNRSSSKALAVLRQLDTITSVRSSERTFLLAMSCCVRDKKNPNALENAIEVLDIMSRARGQASVAVLQSFIELISASGQSESSNKAVERLLRDMRDPNHIAKMDGGVELLKRAVGCLHVASGPDTVSDNLRETWQDMRNRFNQAIATVYNPRPHLSTAPRDNFSSARANA